MADGPVKWEYLIVESKAGDDDLATLNAHGAEGWEAMWVERHGPKTVKSGAGTTTALNRPDRWFFKRPAM